MYVDLYVRRGKGQVLRKTIEGTQLISVFVIRPVFRLESAGAILAVLRRGLVMSENTCVHDL